MTPISAALKAVKLRPALWQILFSFQLRHQLIKTMFLGVTFIRKETIHRAVIRLYLLVFITLCHVT